MRIGAKTAFATAASALSRPRPGHRRQNAGPSPCWPTATSIAATRRVTWCVCNSESERRVQRTFRLMLAHVATAMRRTCAPYGKDISTRLGTLPSNRHGPFPEPLGIDTLTHLATVCSGSGGRKDVNSQGRKVANLGLRSLVPTSLLCSRQSTHNILTRIL